MHRFTKIISYIKVLSFTIVLLFVTSLVLISEVNAIAEPYPPIDGGLPEDDGWIKLVEVNSTTAINLGDYIDKYPQLRSGVRYLLIVNNGGWTASPGADIDGIEVHNWAGEKDGSVPPDNNNPNNFDVCPWGNLNKKIFASRAYVRHIPGDRTCRSRGEKACKNSGGCFWDPDETYYPGYKCVSVGKLKNKPKVCEAINEKKDASIFYDYVRKECFTLGTSNSAIGDPRDCSPCDCTKECPDDTGANLCRVPAAGAASYCCAGHECKDCSRSLSLGSANYKWNYTANGFLIYDIAFDKSFSDNENPGRKIIDGPGNDFTIYEVPDPEDYTLYILPYSNGPTVVNGDIKKYIGDLPDENFYDDNSEETNIPTSNPGCDDFNPLTFEIRYEKGEEDFAAAAFWIDDNSPNLNEVDSSIHGYIEKKDGKWYINGLGCDGPYDNCTWDVGGEEVVNIPSNDPYICSTYASEYSDSLSNGGYCPEKSFAKWTVESLVEETNGSDEEELIINIKVWFQNTTIGTNLDVYGWVMDTEGTKDEWKDIGDLTLDFTPPSLGISTSAVENGKSTLTWAASDSGSGIVASIAKKRCTNSETGVCETTGGSDLTSWSSLDSLNDADDITIEEDETYTYQLRGWDNVCNISPMETATLRLAGPWMMTANGDAYVLNGVNGMQTYFKTSYEDSIFELDDEEAYFTTYLLSNLDGSQTKNVGKASYYGYLMDNYSDRNAADVYGGTYDIYGYLRNLYERNQEGCEDVGVNLAVASKDLPNDCSGYNVFFMDDEDGTAVEVPSGWDLGGNEVDDDNACIIISEGDIQVGTDVDRIDGMLITNGTFITNNDTDILEINGSVYAGEVDFGRSLEDNSVDPSEIIIYQPKYLKIMRECFGRSYPIRLRENKFSE